MLRRLISKLLAVYADAYRDLPREVWLLSLALLVNRAGTMVLPFLSLYLTRELGLPTPDAGKLIAVYGAGAVTGSALGGWLSDRVDPVRVQRWTLVLTGALMLSLIGVTETWLLALLFFLVGMVGDAFRPAMMVAVTRSSTPEQRTRSFALMRLAANAGMAIGPGTGGWLASVNYDLLFVVDAVTCVGAAAVLLIALPTLPSDAGGEEEDAVRPSLAPARDFPFLMFLVVIFAVSISFFQVFTVLPLHLRDSYGLQESSIGSILALNAIIIVVFEMVLLRRLERIEPLHVAAVGGLMLGAGLAMLPLGPPLIFAVLATMVWTLGEMLLLPISTVIVASRAGPSNTGGYMGFYLVTFGIAFVVAPWLGTHVYEHYGPGMLWGATGITGLLIAAGCVALRPWLGRRAGEDPQSA